MKFPTTLETCGYTTLSNINVRTKQEQLGHVL